MSAIGCVGLSTVGGVPILSSTITNATVDGHPVIGVGSPVPPHGSGPHASATMVDGTDKFIVNGIKVCLVGHAASCGHTLEGGSSQSESA